MRIPRRRGQGVFLYRVGRGIEPADFSLGVLGEPDAAVGGHDDAVRARLLGGRLEVAELAGRGVEAADAARGLVCIPDDAVRSDGGVVRECPGARNLVFDDRGGGRGECRGEADGNSRTNEGPAAHNGPPGATANLTPDYGSRQGALGPWYPTIR